MYRFFFINLLNEFDFRFHAKYELYIYFFSIYIKMKKKIRSRLGYSKSIKDYVISEPVVPHTNFVYKLMK